MAKLAHPHFWFDASGPRRPRWWALIAQVVATAALLVWGIVPSKFASGTTMQIRETLRCDLPNRADYEEREWGYYERLIERDRRLGELGELPRAIARQSLARPENAGFAAGPLTLPVDDIREFVLKPSLATNHAGARWTTNSLGMRDQEYARRKPAGTFRIALVGDSIAAGWGVEDGKGFEPVLERVLDERSRAGRGSAIEILNLAVPGHSPGARWQHLVSVGWALEPDMVIFEATEADLGWDERRLRGLLPRGIGWDSPLYRDALADAGVRPGATADAYKRELHPYRAAILAEVYRTAAADCRARHVPAVWVLIPRVGKASEPAERAWLVAQARGAGFSTVLDLSDTYSGLDPKALAVGPDDYHPNADGHARLARRLDQALGRRPELSRVWAKGDDPR
jgi:lysophospholipase L1-like esterase